MPPAGIDRAATPELSNDPAHSCENTIMVVRRLALALVAVAVPTRLARAEVPSAIPFGDTWHCYRVEHKYNRIDRSAACVRTAEICEAGRERMQDESNEVSACVEQAKASVVTYFDVMRDEWRFWAHPSTESCAETRRFLAKSPDNRHIANCQLVGKRLPAPTKFRPEAIDPGDAWYCQSSKLRACSRDQAACEQLGIEDGGDAASCTRQAKVSAFTARNSSGNFVAISFASSSVCTAARDSVALSWNDVSACAAVGAITRPRVDRSLVPTGNAWSCYTFNDATGVGGWCTRDADECNSHREIDDASKNPTACIKVDSVFVRTADATAYAYPTVETCEKRMRAAADGSRCELLK